MLGALLFKHWEVEDDHSVTPSAYRFHARYALEPAHCPHCGSIRKPHVHGHPVVKVRDAPMHGRSVMIELTRDRYLCKDCGRTFSADIPELHPAFDMTNRLVEYIRDHGLRKPYLAVAKEVGLRSDGTVRAICKPYLEWLLQGHAVYAPVILGIDELKLDGKLRIAITDTGERRVIEILEDDSKATLRKFLRALPGSNRILAVTLDMRKSFREVVREELPFTHIIADKFHVLRMANKRIDEFRSDARHMHEAKRKEAKAAGRRVPRKLKNKWSDRRVLHMSPSRRAKLKPMKAMLFEATLANDKALAGVWQAKEDFYAIWDKAKSAREFAELFEVWRANLSLSAKPHFDSVAKQVDEWGWEISNYFSNPYTNAYAEAANRLIKVINRQGYGYKFDGIRARAIHMTRDRNSSHFVCEECLGRFPADQGRVRRFIDDILPPVTVCADGCSRPHGYTTMRVMAHGPFPTVKSE